MASWVYSMYRVLHGCTVQYTCPRICEHKGVTLAPCADVPTG